MATNRRRVLLSLAGDPSDAKRAINDVRDEMKAFAAQKAEARAEIKTGAAEAQLTALRARLARLGEQEATPAVQIKTARVLEQIEKVEAKLAALGRRNVDVNVDVDRRGALSRIVSGAAGVFTGIAGAIGGFATGVAKSLREIPALGAGIAVLGTAGLAAIPIFVILGTVLTALAASFAAAVAGLAALATALGVAFLPVAAVVIGVVVSLAKVFKSLTQGAKDQTNANRAVADAARGVVDAQQGVTDAQANLKTASTDAWRAYHDAIETVKDDLRDVEHAKLNIEGARLTTKRAEQDLADFKRTLGGTFASLTKFTDVNVSTSGLEGAIHSGSPGITNDDALRLEELIHRVREAKLGEKDATDGLQDATTKLARDRRTEAKYLQEGIDAYPGYVAALKQVASAQRNLADADRRLARSRSDLVKQNRELNPTEKALASTLKGVGNAAKGFLTPAVSDALEGFAKGAGSLSAIFKDTGLKSAIRSIGRAIGSVFESFGRELGSKRNIEAFTVIGRGAARLVRLFGSHVFKDLFTILRDIAEVALKPLLSRIRGVARYFDDLADSSRKHGRLKRFVDGLVESFDNWWELIKAVAHLIGTIFGGTKKSGDSIVETMTTLIKKFDQWLQDTENRRKVKDFLIRVKDLAIDVKNAFVDVRDAIRDAFDLLAKANDKFHKIPGPVRKALEGSVPGIGPLLQLGDDLLGEPEKPGKIKPLAVRPPRLKTPKLSPPHAPSGRDFSSRSAPVVQNFGDVVLPPTVAPIGDPNYDATKFHRGLRKLGVVVP